MSLASLRTKLQQGHAILGAWISLGDLMTTELVSTVGYDVVCLDLQHGNFDSAKATTLIQSMRDNAIPFARVSSNDDGLICRALDSGALGIICPMINNVEQCKNFVNACYYPPKGRRSFGPYRTPLVKAYHEKNGETSKTVPEWSNDNILSFAMVETKEALENLPQMLTVPGLTGVFVGPNDLGMSLGEKKPTSKPKGSLLEQILQVRSACSAAGKKTGIFCADGSTAKEMVEAGFDYVNAFWDVSGVTIAAQTELARTKG